MDTFLLTLALLHHQLSHPDFNVRERATGAMQPDCYVALLLTLSDDPEVVARAFTKADRLCEWNRLSAEWDARGWPWLDSIPLSSWSYEAIPTDPAGTGGPEWNNWRKATRNWAECLIKKGYWPSEVKRALVSGEQRCKYWCEHQQYPPEDWTP